MWMWSIRKNAASIAAAFVALGIGIMIGGALGPSWIDETEHRIMRKLMFQYEEQLARNRTLQQQIGSLEMIRPTTYTALKDKKIIWVGTPLDEDGLLPAALRFAGATVIPASSGERLSGADIVVVTRPRDGISNNGRLSDGITQQSGDERLAAAKIVEAGAAEWNSMEPEQVARFLMYLNKVAEEETREAFGFYRYTGKE